MRKKYKRPVIRNAEHSKMTPLQRAEYWLAEREGWTNVLLDYIRQERDLPWKVVVK